tara:strand:+ start:110 stop:1432 length:1323 start_codon:yes stop_codon:yes gene_type:complete
VPTQKFKLKQKSQIMPFTLQVKTFKSAVTCILCTIVGCLVFSTATWANVRILVIPENSDLKDIALLSIKLYITNDTSPVVTFVPPPKIRATLKKLNDSEANTVPVSLHLVDTEQQRQPFELLKGQFHILTYVLTLPEEMNRSLPQNLALTLVLPDHDSQTALVSIPSRQADKTTPLIVQNKNYNTPERESTGDQSETAVSFFANFAGYEPVYFLYGAEPSNAKFQISFKYRFVNPHGKLAQNWPWFSKLYLGYTQTSFWDLSAKSRPFRDTIFQPTLFYQYHLKNPGFIPTASHFNILAGVQHQSNGKDGSASRSLNMGYIEPGATFPIGENLELNLRARAWLYLGDKSDNPDIRDFRGNGMISIGLGNPDGLMLGSELRGNPGTGKGSVQFDLSYPLNHIFFRNLDLYLFGQLYSGYGESLIDYNRKDTRLRFGIALQR